MKSIKKAVVGTLARVAMSPFTVMPGRSFSGPLPAVIEKESKAALACEAHVRTLAEKIGERHIGRPQALADSVDYISSVLHTYGYKAVPRPFQLMGKTVHNVEAILPGKSKKVLVVGAHYDSIPGSPGADDNASGVAVLLEMAKLLRLRSLDFTVHFVAFANEEHPSLPNTTMGSYDYARYCRESGLDVRMMVLEMLGSFSWEKNSQHYPSPFNLIYPTEGNFVAFVGNWNSRALVREAVGKFRDNAFFPSEGVAAPERFKDLARSDHWAFWQFGYQALMVTDTANFRNHRYHTERDTPDTLNYEAMGRVSVGLAEMVKAMGGIGQTGSKR